MKIKQLEWRPVNGGDAILYAPTPATSNGFRIYYEEEKFYSNVMFDHEGNSVPELVKGHDSVEAVQALLQTVHDKYLMQFLEE